MIKVSASKERFNPKYDTGYFYAILFHYPLSCQYYFVAAYTQAHFRPDFIMEANTLSPNETVLLRVI